MTPYDQTYRILSLIGEGGMGRVYLVEHVRLGNRWAMKAVSKRAGMHVDLLGESNMLKRLDHPALPRIIDIFEDKDDLYIVEDYIEGVSLDRLLREEGKIPEETVLAWAEQLARVLIYLHGQKPNPIIYRDMKPGNIMITTKGQVKLIDFGIAREYKDESAGDTTYLGTRGYAAPEQFGTTQTDARTDIFGLGATLYHLVSGRSRSDPPYYMVPLRTIDASLSEGIEHIVAKCTREDPAERYQTAVELLDDIVHIDKFSSAVRRRRVLDALKITGCALLIAGGIFMSFLGDAGLKKEASSALAAQYTEGGALLDSGDFDHAEVLLIAADAQSGDMRGHVALMAALVNAGEMERAAAFAKDAAARFSQLEADAQFQYGFGLALDETGDARGALERFERADALEPANPAYLRSLARAYAAQGNIERANEKLEDLQRVADDDTTAFVYAGILQAQGQWREAIGHYQKCVALTQSDDMRFISFRETADLYKENRAASGDALDREIETLLAMQTSYPGREAELVWDRLGDAWYALGLRDNDSEALHGAAESFESVIALGYGRDSTYLNIATVRQRLGQYDAAEDILVQLLNRSPASADAHVQLAFVIAEREGQKPQEERDYAPVLEHYEKAVSLGAAGVTAQRLAGVVADLQSGGWLGAGGT